MPQGICNSYPLFEKVTLYPLYPPLSAYPPLGKVTAYRVILSHNLWYAVVVPYRGYEATRYTDTRQPTRAV